MNQHDADRTDTTEIRTPPPSDGRVTETSRSRPGEIAASRSGWLEAAHAQ
jgi:hypothetical protein